MSEDGITRKARLQAELFPESDVDPLNPHADEAKLPAKRGPGRPAGAANKSTREMREFLLANYRDPLLGLAQVAMMRPQDLALALGCTLLEAFDRILKARETVTQYVHQKLPQAVEIEGGGAVVLNIGLVGAGEAVQVAQGGPVTITGTLAAPSQDQSLSERKPADLDATDLDK